MVSSTTRESSLARALARYIDARTDALREARKTLGINEMDARALLFIAENPGLKSGELRDHLNITSAGVTTLIDRLAERDAVRREPDASDRRVSRIHLTIDLRADPWNILTRFDDDLTAAALSKGAEVTDPFAELLEELTASASGR
ncbi:MarR family transcriptional regulator [Microbacterium sp. cx-55]|uniref:MarR family winged helix-turn-helix transcriptional regulator n=1 Tax=unclassified Microbacterium TaxID=2609290 RepID=UPI001CBDCEB9|nr:MULTISPECIES: MarR family transcriptional regulator [unclassified Microbacterium]MBZ4487707.1 MarR family transcriptional regulator [Microbacterium sp. cx-55]MCC4908142.1 MarR family transcriptional regulator [Microbacterium sp. cx-59]UGB35718.1 MarR family transcriptional regulator [Microbacterium sp. cx-55]